MSVVWIAQQGHMRREAITGHLQELLDSFPDMTGGERVVRLFDNPKNFDMSLANLTNRSDPEMVVIIVINLIRSVNTRGLPIMDTYAEKYGPLILPGMKLFDPKAQPAV